MAQNVELVMYSVLTLQGIFRENVVLYVCLFVCFFRHDFALLELPYNSLKRV